MIRKWFSRALIFSSIALVALQGFTQSIALDANLHIVSPKSGLIVSPGDNIEIVASAAPGLEPWIGADCLAVSPNGDYMTRKGDIWVWKGRVVNAFAPEGACRVLVLARNYATSKPEAAEPLYLIPHRIEKFTALRIEDPGPGECLKTDLVIHAMNSSPYPELFFVTFDPTMTISSDDPSIVAYLGNGKIIGKKPGKTTIRAKYLQPQGGILTASTEFEVESDARGCNTKSPAHP